jgi:ribosomal protein S6--L-glutamate ligase
MKVAVLSRNSKLYSTRRLVEAGHELGFEVSVVDYLRCFMNIATHRPKVHYQGVELSGIDAVIPRIGASHTFYGTAVVRQFEMMNVASANESQGIARSRDKLRSLQLLSRKGIGLPVTSFAHSTKDIDGLLNIVGGAPVVVKLVEGTQGIGVVLCETRKAAEAVIEAFRGLDANILVQEFIAEAGGADIRCFVIGDKVVASMKRQAVAGDHDQAHAGGKEHGGAGSQGDGAPHRRRRHPPSQPRTRRDGGQQFTGAGGHREGERDRRGQEDHGVRAATARVGQGRP